MNYIYFLNLVYLLKLWVDIFWLGGLYMNGSLIIDGLIV